VISDPKLVLHRISLAAAITLATILLHRDKNSVVEWHFGDMAIFPKYEWLLPGKISKKLKVLEFSHKHFAKLNFDIHSRCRV